MAKRAKAANVGPEPEEQQPSLPKLIENCLCLHLSGPIMCQACFLASVSSHVLTGSGFLHFPIMRFRVGAQRTSRRHPEPLRIRCHRLQTRVPALPSQLLFAQNCSVRGESPRIHISGLRISRDWDTLNRLQKEGHKSTKDAQQLQHLRHQHQQHHPHLHHHLNTITNLLLVRNDRIVPCHDLEYRSLVASETTTLIADEEQYWRRLPLWLKASSSRNNWQASRIIIARKSAPLCQPLNPKP